MFRSRLRRGATTNLLPLGLSIFLLTALTACGDSGSSSTAIPATSTSTATAVIEPPATSTTSSVPTATQDQEPSPEPTETIAPDPEIAQAVKTLLDGQQGVYGIVLSRSDGTIAYEQNANTPFVAASLYKLVLLANIYEKRERDELSFDQEVELLPEYFPEAGDFADSVYDESTVGSYSRVEDLLFEAGAFSSNVAAKALLSLTDNASLDRTTIELGLADTYLFIDPTTLPAWSTSPTPEATPDLREALKFVATEAESGPINITTPHDVFHYYSLLLSGDVINARVSQDILEILKQQMVDDRFPYLLPPGTEMAHKTGNLDHVVHDAGIIWTDDGPVILVAMAEDQPNDDIATQVIQRLALIAYGERSIPPFTDQAVETPVDGNATGTEDEPDANG